MKKTNWNTEMLKEGIYRTKEARLTIEKHGGVSIKHYIYLYLCFYPQTRGVGLYGTQDENYRKPYLENNIELTGKLTKQTESNLKFHINNRNTGIKIFFSGYIEGEDLYLTYYHEDQPEVLYENVFKYIGNGNGME